MPTAQTRSAGEGGGAGWATDCPPCCSTGLQATSCPPFQRQLKPRSLSTRVTNAVWIRGAMLLDAQQDTGPLGDLGPLLYPCYVHIGGDPCHHHTRSSPPSGPP